MSTTLDSIAQQISGKAFQSKYVGLVSTAQTDYPYTDVTGLVNWEGSPAALRGTGKDYAFANPRDGVTSTGEPVVTVDLYILTNNNNYTSAGAYDILGYNGTNIILGAEPFNAGSGYAKTLLIHDTTLQPGVTDETYPFTVGTSPTTTVTLPPVDTTVPTIPCYLAGTRVATSRGDVAVESLKVGDMVRTVDGAAALRPVLWIGQRSIDADSHPEPEQILPIRIRAHAFGDSQPARDLLVSPDHAIFVDGALIPARLLVNGGSVTQDATVRAIRYVHVELDAHAVMLAEGLPAESYLPGANRQAFANAPGVTDLHPVFATDAAAYAERACARLVIDASEVLPVWTRVAARGASLGMTPSLPQATADAALRVVAGKRALAASADGDTLTFKLPRGAKSVRLVSRGARPADTRPWLDDRRRLGVMVAGIAVQTGRGRTEIAMDDRCLTEGWWAAEDSALGAVRWTNGDAVVDLPRGAKTIELRIVGDMSYPLELAAAA